jgi:Flp pilus assembly protein TadD
MLHSVRRLALVFLAGASAAPALAQQAAAPAVVPAAAGDTALWSLVGRSARAKTTDLHPTTPPENARVVSQYREALGDIEGGRYGDALLTLQAVIQRAPQNALYHGDLAYALLRAGRFDEAGNAYARAFQLLRTNAWFVVGIAAAHAAQRQWPDAAGTIQLAAQIDSSAIAGPVASYAGGWFEEAGDGNGALTWARLAVQRTPDDAGSWLRIAKYLRARNDSTPEGPAAVMRYRAMRPDDRLGIALYADLLFNTGKADSALALMATAAQDSAYREFAAQMYLQAGRDLFQRRDSEGAIRVLRLGQPYATPEQLPAFSNIIGRSQLLMLNAALSALEENRSCAAARSADSLVTRTEQNLRDGISFDSARTMSMLDNILPQYRINAANAVRTCSDAPANARPAPRPATRRPAVRPRP